MFSLLISGMQAYNQVGLFFGACIFLAIGGLLAGSSFYWRVHSLRALGTIIGVIPNGKTYAPVYRYTLADGQTHVAKANIASNLVHGMTTGRKVALLISPHNPSDARQANDWTGEIIGLVFLAPGVWLGWTALTAYPITPMTWLMAAGFALYLGERALRVLRRNGPHVSIAEWIAMIRQGDATDIDMSDVRPIESLVPQEVLKSSWRAKLRAHRKFAWVPALLVAVFLYAGLTQGEYALQLEVQGIRVPGVVAEYDETNNANGHWAYYAQVHFRIPGATIQFRDSVGGNPPPLRLGEAVTVLYLPGAPWTAIVDRGPAINMLFPELLLAGAVFCLWLVLIMLTGRVRAADDGAASLSNVPAE